jgi:hypothetical protein
MLACGFAQDRTIDPPLPCLDVIEKHNRPTASPNRLRAEFGAQALGLRMSQKHVVFGDFHFLL